MHTPMCCTPLCRAQLRAACTQSRHSSHHGHTSTAAAPHAVHTPYTCVCGGTHTQITHTHTHPTPPPITQWGWGHWRGSLGLPQCRDVAVPLGAGKHGGGTTPPGAASPGVSRGWTPRTSPTRCRLTPLGWGGTGCPGLHGKGVLPASASFLAPPYGGQWGLFCGEQDLLCGERGLPCPQPCLRTPCTGPAGRGGHGMGGSPGGTPARELPCVGSLSTPCPLCSAPRVPPAGAGVPARAGLPAPRLQRQALRPGRPPRAAQHPGRTAACAWRVRGVCMVCG